MEINPKYVEAWNSKGIALDNLGKHKEAIECYDKALEINPRDAPAWYNKGLAFSQLGNYDEAIRCYDKAIGLDPSDPIDGITKEIILIA